MLKYNNPKDLADRIEIDYSNFINVDRRQTIGYLRDKISKAVSIPKEKLILRRGGIHGAEMKNDKELIKDCHLFDMASIFVEEGTPADSDEHRLAIFEVSYSKSNIDNSFYEFTRKVF